MATWNTAVIRELLSRALDPGELRTLCFDDPELRPALDRFSDGMGKDRMIQRLIEYCARRELMDTLLQRVQEMNPRQYANYAGRLHRAGPGDPSPIPPEATAPPVPESEEEASESYFDVQIRIQGLDAATRAYPVEIRLANGSHFEGGALRLDRDLLAASEQDPQRYGHLLFEALFDSPLLGAYHQAVAYADLQCEGRLRIRLWIDHAAAELHAVVWERIHHSVQGMSLPVAAAAKTPFSRYIGLQARDPAPIAERPIRMLFVVSNPSDIGGEGVAPLEVEQEIETLADALGDLNGTDMLRVTCMPGRSGVSDSLRQRLEREGYQLRDGAASMDHILKTLSQDDGCHVLHFLGHGQFNPRWQRAELLLEDGQGQTAHVTDDRVAALLTSTDSPLSLIFLAACKSARRSEANPNPFVGLAPKLVQVGVPAVVAMQDTIPMPTARRLTREFYRYLLAHGVVDRAMNQARLLLFQSSGADWATPVLFTRLKEGRLFAASR